MTIHEWWRRAGLLLRRDRATRELEEEMRLHREHRAEQLRAEGMAPAEAELAARRRFGNQGMFQQASRDAWGFQWIDDAVQDLRYAGRRLRQRPGFTFAVVGILALGTGATTAMFSAVDAAMLRPLPFTHPDELVSLPVVSVPFDPGPAARAAQGPNHRSGYGPSWAVTVDDIASMHAQFSRVAVWAAGGLNLSDPDHPVRLKVGVVSADFFGTLGVSPIAGRAFLPEDGREGAPKVIVLSYGLWQRQFGGEGVIGRMLVLNGRGYQVVGVMPPRFSFPQESNVWIPLSIPDGPETFEAFHGYLPTNVIARLAPDVSVRGASAALLTRWEQSIGSQAANPQSYGASQLTTLRRLGAAVPLRQELVGTARLPLLLLLSATGLLLLVACANVTNLLLSQSFARRREIAVREILGARRGRIVRQLLLESALLGIGGAIIGAALAPLAFGLIGGLFPDALAGVVGASINGQVLAATLLLGILATATFGLWPALATAGIAPGEIVKLGTGPGGGTGRIGTARRVLVGAEVALTVVLLIGAGLMLRSFSRVMGLDRGMITEHVGTLRIAFPSLSSSSADRFRVVNEIIQRLDATPGVTAAGAVNDLPLGGGGGLAVTVHIDRPANPNGTAQPYARMLYATAGYFDAMGIQLTAGRTFRESDDSTAPAVTIVSMGMAKKDWATTDPVGETLSGWTGKPATVVGVVSDVRELSLEHDPMPQMYAAMSQATPSAVAVVARGTLPPATLLAAMRQAVHTADPSQAVYDMKMMDAVLNSAMAPRRTNTALISLFAALALVLASLGVYAVASYGVAQRNREFGIRAALGATARDLAALVSREMLWVTGTGLIVGLAGAWMLARVAESLIYG
ncbi:MAG: ADOP family duplicated permease, partial [Gemmatimonadales bacterium]